MRIPALLVTAMLCTFAASPALAVSEGAPALYQPLLITSARAAGLGGVTVVIEESGVSGWRNPGFLAFDRKIRGTWSETQLVPDLADDIWLRSVLVSGHFRWGLPITLAGGWAKLDFGESVVVNDDGIEVTRFESYDETWNGSAAVELFETIGLGATVEHVYSKLAPPIPELGITDGDGEAWSVNLGAGARRRFVVPMGSTGESGHVISITPLAGASFLHWGGEISYNDEDDAEELSKHLHLGLGLRVAHEPPFMKRFFDPMRLTQVSFAAYFERTKPKVGEDDERILHRGIEIGILGLASVRYGYVDDPDGDITDTTNGWGLGIEDVLPVDFRVDYASFPQATDLERVERWDVMVSADPRLIGL